MSSSIRYFFVLLWFWLCLPFRPALLRQAYAQWLVDAALDEMLAQQVFEDLAKGPEEVQPETLPEVEEVPAVAPAEAAPSPVGLDERITLIFEGPEGEYHSTRTILRSKRRDRVEQGHGDTFTVYNFYAFIDGNYVYRQRVEHV